MSDLFIFSVMFHCLSSSEKILLAFVDLMKRGKKKKTPEITIIAFPPTHNI
jgi:hypothetical protein